MKSNRFFNLLDDNTRTTLQLATQMPNPVFLTPVQEGWSSIEILEHICLTDQLISNLIFGQPDGIAKGKFLIRESKLQYLLVQDIQRLDAPDFVRPRGTVNSSDQFIHTFSEIRKNLKERLTIPCQLPENRYYHTPLLGNLTVNDWLFFIIFHTERHLNQIRRIMLVSK